jgi:hypothetical protein
VGDQRETKIVSATRKRQKNEWDEACERSVGRALGDYWRLEARLPAGDKVYDVALNRQLTPEGGTRMECALEVRRRSDTSGFQPLNFPVNKAKLRRLVHASLRNPLWVIARSDGSIWWADAERLLYALKDARALAFRCTGSQEKADDSWRCSLQLQDGRGPVFTAAPADWKKKHLELYGYAFDEDAANEGRPRYQENIIPGSGFASEDRT